MRHAIALVCLGTGIAAAAPPGQVTVVGHVANKDTGELLAGVTVVAEAPEGAQTAITDEQGAFSLDVPAAATKLTFYYLETTLEKSISPNPSFDTIDIGKLGIAVRDVPECSGWGEGFSAPMIDQLSAFSLSFYRAFPTSRARDTAALVPLAAGASRSGTTLFDGGRRLAGAPGVALALVGDVDVLTGRGAFSLDQRADGVAVTPNSGSNENKGIARLAPSTAGTAFEVGAGGPIVADSAWWWAGGVRGPDGEQELARVDYAASYSQQGHVVALHQEVPASVASSARPLASELRDDWVDATWTSKLNDGKTQLTEGVTGERLDDGSRTTRGAVYAQLVQRLKLAGHHEARASAELGGGKLDAAAHRDAGAAVADAWQFQPDLYFDAGVRWDARSLGDATAAVWQPHGTVGYDWTKEGRSEVYVTADRASLLDATRLGAALAGPRSRDDYAAGVRYELHQDWLAGIAIRAMRLGDTRRAGVDAQLDHRGRPFELHVTASSVERAVAGYLRLSKDRAVGGDTRWTGRAGVFAGLAGRWAGAADDPWGSQIAANLGLHRKSKDGLDLSLGGEYVRDREGSLGRAVLTMSY